MKETNFKSYDELPLFLNAKTVSQVLGISSAGTYELLHRKDFPVVKIGSRLVIPKEQFLAWIEKQIGGDAKYFTLVRSRDQEPEISFLCRMPSLVWDCLLVSLLSTPT